MNEILGKVTPLTKGIIWLHPGVPSPASATYKAVDYLLNGLLTAGLSKGNPEASSRVLLSTNFHSPFHVFIVDKLVKQEYESFLLLLKKDLTSESSVLVIDEADGFSSLLSKTPNDVKSLLHLFK